MTCFFILSWQHHWILHCFGNFLLLGHCCWCGGWACDPRASSTLFFMAPHGCLWEASYMAILITVLGFCIGVVIGVYSEEKTKPVFDKISHASHTNNIRKGCFHINSSELHFFRFSKGTILSCFGVQARQKHVVLARISHVSKAFRIWCPYIKLYK